MTRSGKNFAVVVEVAAIVGFILRFQDNDTWHMTHDKKWKNFAVVVEVAAIVGFILRFQDNNINLTYTNKNDNIKYRILLLLGLVGFELNIN